MLRTRGREYALQLLYETDTTAVPLSLALPRFWGHFADTSDARDFTESLVTGVAAHSTELDQLIERTSTNWRLERMPYVDRNVLRLAAYELTHSPEIPVAVVINEAVELGKRYGSQESGAFINGILDRMAHEVGRTK